MPELPMVGDEFAGYRLRAVLGRGGMSAGMIPGSGAAGRVFCTFANGQENFVWTQDDGHLLGYAAGPVHEDVWNWWYAVHHNIGFGGMPPMKM
jgi:hypothetical protein